MSNQVPKQAAVALLALVVLSGCAGTGGGKGLSETTKQVTAEKSQPPKILDRLIFGPAYKKDISNVDENDDGKLYIKDYIEPNALTLDIDYIFKNLYEPMINEREEYINKVEGEKNDVCPSYERFYDRDEVLSEEYYEVREKEEINPGYLELHLERIIIIINYFNDAVNECSITQGKKDWATSWPDKVIGLIE